MRSLPYFFEFETREAIPLKALIPEANNEALDLIENLLQLNPEKRMKISEALKHPYFENTPKERNYTKKLQEIDIICKIESDKGNN